MTEPAAPAIEVMNDDVPNPRKHFDTPEQLLADPDLTDDEKQALLTEWDSEMDGRLSAESEGMSASDPISHATEAQLADEATHVKSALIDITEKQADA